MLRRFAVGLVFAGAVFAACGGGATTLDVAKYDRSCTTASDCVVVVTDSCCGCPNAAISNKDLAQYEADLAAAGRNCPQCEEKPCAPLPAQCAAGVCTTGASMPDAGTDAASDAGADAGVEAGGDAGADAQDQDGGADASAD